MNSDHNDGDAGDSASVNPSPSSLLPASGSSSVSSVFNVPPVLDPRLGRLEITTENVVKPRSECQGGHSQLILGNKTKPPLTEEERKARAIARVKSKIGEEIAKKILKKWEETKNKTEKKKRQPEGDGVIKTLLAIGLSEIEIRAFLGVGQGRIARVKENRPKPPPKTPKHAVNDGDKKADYRVHPESRPGARISLYPSFNSSLC